MISRRMFDQIENLQREIDSMCGRGNHCVAIVPKKEGTNKAESSRIPVLDVYETENSVIAAFELPGVSKEDMELTVTENRLEVKVCRKTEQESEKEGGYSYEKRSFNFYRALPLPSNLLPESAQATYVNGLLRVEIPKAKKQDLKKKIEIT